MVLHLKMLNACEANVSSKTKHNLFLRGSFRSVGGQEKGGYETTTTRHLLPREATENIATDRPSQNDAVPFRSDSSTPRMTHWGPSTLRREYLGRQSSPGFDEKRKYIITIRTEKKGSVTK